MRACRSGVGISRVAVHGLHGMHGFFAGGTVLLLGLVLMTGAWAAEPPTIPTADFPAPHCTVGQPCTFAAPVFACDFANAEKIAAAGELNGRAIGTGQTRDNTCQTVPAGRPVTTEATKSAQVVYLTRDGQHLGYMPVGVFALGGSWPQTACDQPGFCAVRPGPPIYLCPKAGSLTLPTAEAKAAAKCLRISDSNAGEVLSVNGTTVTLANMFGGRPPYESLYYGVRAEFIGLSLQSRPTPAGRGWCRPDTWCVTTASTMFCSDRAAYERVQAMPPGEPRRLAIQGEPGCRIVVGGNVLKPNDSPVAGDAGKVISVQHPTLAAGWAGAEAFPIVAFNPPLRDTARFADLTISPGRGPVLAAVALSGQGSNMASGAFRSGPRERRTFCQDYVGDEQTSEFRDCLSEPDATLMVRADCYERRVSLDDRRYGLFERPRAAAPDIHIDPSRRWLFRDLKDGEWLDGSGASGEVPVGTAFNALCPGVDPDVSIGLVYHDPQAAFPRDLWGRWFDGRRACADPGRNAADYEEHGVMDISAGERGGNRDLEYSQRINAVRRVAPQSWQVDGSHRVDAQDAPEIFDTATYTLTRDGLTLTRQDETSKWVRCR